MGRTENEERLVFQKGAIEVAAPLDEKMTNSTILVLDEVQSLFASAKQLDNWKMSQPVEEEDIMTTIFVVREAYANPCWAVIVIYQTWLLIQEFAIEKFRIVWLDGHAHTPMDSMWPHLFGPNVYHLKNFINATSRTEFTKSFLVQAAPTAMSNEGLKIHKNGHVCTPNSRLDQFRNWVLERYGLLESANHSTAIGVRPKTITLLARRNYVAHPRSDGIVDRTLHRLNETVVALKERYPNDKVQVVSFESIPVAEQLSIIARTDLLLAVHGAGNVHAIFLQPGSVFVEFFPKGFQSRQRFRFLAQSAGIQYVSAHAKVHEKIAENKIIVDILDAVKMFQLPRSGMAVLKPKPTRAFKPPPRTKNLLERPTVKNGHTFPPTATLEVSPSPIRPQGVKRRYPSTVKPR
jgi:hypothetical protein